MSRPALIKTSSHPCHITARTLDHSFFTTPMNEVWDLMCKLLFRAHKVHSLNIHAFVLMSNHFHLLCHTPQSNIDEIMMMFMRDSALQLRKTNLEKQLWGESYHWSVIDNVVHYNYVYKYIFQNPLRAKLVERVEDYPYSTVINSVPFPLHSSTPIGFGGVEGELLWLNDLFEKEDEEIIRLGLKRSQFGLNQKRLKQSRTLKINLLEERFLK